MNDEHTPHEPLGEQLIELQQQIREATQRRAELLSAGERRERDAIDQELARLRRERQALLDEQLRRQREAHAAEEGAAGLAPAATVVPRRVSGARGAPPLMIRLVTILLVFGGVAAIIVGGIFFVAERFLVPPPVEGIAQESDEADFAIQEGQSAEERLLALYLAARRDDILRAPSDDSTPVTFQIETGETGTTIAARLEQAGLVEDAELFRRLLQYRGADQSLEAGTYQLARDMRMDEIIVALQEGREEEVTFTLLEGWRAEEMAAALEANGLTTAAEYMALVSSPSFFEYDFLQGLPEGSTLEGYLFPDTYSVFRAEADAESIIRLQLDTFAQRVTPELRQAAANRQMTVHEAVTLASIVEREAVVAEERPIIAGVYINRWLDGTVLNADPTIQYALGFQQESGEWWKRPLTRDDLAVVSPYNSYTERGLPPGPISNPGFDTIRATIAAPPTDFYYFVSRNDGTHVFASTLEEHILNVEQFQSGE